GGPRRARHRGGIARGDGRGAGRQRGLGEPPALLRAGAREAPRAAVRRRDQPRAREGAALGALPGTLFGDIAPQELCPLLRDIAPQELCPLLPVLRTGRPVTGPPRLKISMRSGGL